MHINNNNAEEACNEVTSCIYYIRAHAKLLFSKMAVWSCWVFVHFMSTEQCYPCGPIGDNDVCYANQYGGFHDSIVNLICSTNLIGVWSWSKIHVERRCPFW